MSKTIRKEAEDLLKHSVAAVGAQAEGVYKKGLDSVKHVQKMAHDAQVKVTSASKKAGEKIDKQVHEHPWQAISVALGLGVLLSRYYKKQ